MINKRVKNNKFGNLDFFYMYGNNILYALDVKIRDKIWILLKRYVRQRYSLCPIMDQVHPAAQFSPIIYRHVVKLLLKQNAV